MRQISLYNQTTENGLGLVSSPEYFEFPNLKLDIPKAACERRAETFDTTYVYKETQTQTTVHFSYWVRAQKTGGGTD